MRPKPRMNSTTKPSYDSCIAQQFSFRTHEHWQRHHTDSVRRTFNTMAEAMSEDYPAGFNIRPFIQVGSGLILLGTETLKGFSEAEYRYLHVRVVETGYDIETVVEANAKTGWFSHYNVADTFPQIEEIVNHINELRGTFHVSGTSATRHRGPATSYIATIPFSSLKHPDIIPPGETIPC